MAEGNAARRFLDELRDTYDAEKQITKALPEDGEGGELTRAARRIRIASRRDAGTRRALEQVFASLDEKVRGKHCDGMAGHHRRRQVGHGRRLRRHHDGCVPDRRGQRAEHYEMAAYGTLVAWARAMGHTEAADLLQETLDEEKAADEKLSSLAEGGINQEAADAAHPRTPTRKKRKRRRRSGVRKSRRRSPPADGNR